MLLVGGAKLSLVRSILNSSVGCCLILEAEWQKSYFKFVKVLIDLLARSCVDFNRLISTETDFNKTI